MQKTPFNFSFKAETSYKLDRVLSTFARTEKFSSSLGRTWVAFSSSPCGLVRF